MKKKTSRKICVLLFLIPFNLLVNSSNSSAQNDLSFNDYHNRHEGIRSLRGRKHSDLELLSFTRYREEVISDSVILNVKFFLTNDATVTITAEELRRLKNYEMHVNKTNWNSGWNRFFPWPTDEVLRPLKIKVDQLGFLAKLPTEDSRKITVIPLIIYHNSIPEKLNRYTLYLRPQETLKRLVYNIYLNNQDEPIVNREIRITMHANRPYAIRLDFLDRTEGIYRLEIKCRVKNRIKGPKATYIFYHVDAIDREDLTEKH